MRQAAVVGSQKRLTRCFRELEDASRKHNKIPKSQKKVLPVREPTVTYIIVGTMATYITDENTDFTHSLLFSRRIF